MNGLGVELFAGTAFRGEKDVGVGGGGPFGQMLHGLDVFLHSDDGIKRVTGGIGLVYPVEDLFVVPFVGLQFGAEVISVGQERDHRKSAHNLITGKNRVHVHKVDLIALFTSGSMENRFPGTHHLRQTGTRAHVAQELPMDFLGGFPQKIKIGLIGEDDASVAVDKQDALPHGLKNGLGYL